MCGSSPVAAMILLWSCDLTKVSFIHSPSSSRPCPSRRNQSAVNVDVIGPFWCGMNKPSSLDLSRFLDSYMAERVHSCIGFSSIWLREGQSHFPRCFCLPVAPVLLQRYFLSLFSACDPFATSPLPSRMHGKLGSPLLSVAFCYGPSGPSGSMLLVWWYLRHP